MIELKKEILYNEKAKHDILRVWAVDENANRYKVLRSDGQISNRFTNLPNELRIARGLSPYTYEPTDMPIEQRED